jgi:hypothetical protein
VTPFTAFPKIPRYRRQIVITEKIDGTNASIYIGEDGEFLVGSRSRWITPGDDNFGFARWAYEHKDELMLLGPGHHFGEWWGRGIQRGYGLDVKVFSLFNAGRWAADNTPPVVGVVPILYAGPLSDEAIDDALYNLDLFGSKAAPGFMQPEGLIVYHTQSRQTYKVTLDDNHKGA